MTLPELLDTLWQARITVTLKDGQPCAQPAQALAGRPEVMAALKQHRAALVSTLKGTKGARLEGLECGPCNEIESTKTEVALRWCETCRWATPHYPRSN